MKHQQAKNTKGILISPYGRKLDVRPLCSSSHRLFMFQDGELFFNNQSVRLSFGSCCITEQDKNPISSCTIARVIPYENHICIVDDSDVAGNFEDPLAVIEKGVMNLTLAGKVTSFQKDYFIRVVKALSAPGVDLFDITEYMKLQKSRYGVQFT